MKKMAFAATLAALLTANVRADTVGLYLGGQIWQNEANGVLGEKNTQIDFALKKEQQSYYFVAVEHPFPLLPNVRISSTSLDTTGKINLTQAYSFGGEKFPTDDVIQVPNDEFIIDIKLDTKLNASFNASYVDYTLYFELFDNGLFSFDLGLSARYFDGIVTVTGTTNVVATTDVKDHPGHTPDHVGSEITGTTTAKGKIKINEIEPMLNVATNVNFPLTGLSLFAQGDYSLKSEHSLFDYQVGLNYDLVDSKMMDFNVTLGYRFAKVEFEDLYTDLEFKGAFVGVIAHF